MTSLLPPATRLTKVATDHHIILQVAEHTELAWILNCSTSVGRLQRMTTWKVSREAQVDDHMY